VARVHYAASVHGQAEIDAVMEVLTDDAGLWVGRRVRAMERQVAALFGKADAVMCNSGSSGLYLAVELLGLEPGAEVITAGLTFSTDVAPLLRAGLVPAFVDVEPDTYNVDAARIAEMITPQTGAILLPNLVGNSPDWDVVRDLADQHQLKVIEDSCDALGSTLRGTPTGTRSEFSVTSFASSHIITCAGGGGMVMMDDDRDRDRALLLRRWGRRSELHFFGSKRRDRNFWEDLDGVRYDNQFIFDVPAWNFEPSELGAAFGLAQLRSLPANRQRRQRNFALYTEWFQEHAEFVSPRPLAGLDTAWLCYPVLIQPHAGFERAAVQQYLDDHDVDTRTVWTGNVTRQPMMANRKFRVPAAGLPNCDAVMERAFLLPCNHGMDDDAVGYVLDQLEGFLAAWFRHG
jgi:CDP-6-deoxy-D-xylo-4-hexulose-3-dehydrase